MSNEVEGSIVDPVLRRNPWAFFKALREKRPVGIMPGTDFYFVADYGHAIEVLSNVEDYSNAFPEGQTSFVNFDPEADALLAEIGYGRRVPTVVFSDPPLHTHWRRIIGNALKPSVIKSLDAKVHEIVEMLLADIKGDGVHDMVQAVFVPLPMYILADWIGVDREDYPKFKHWSLAANYTLQPPLPKETRMEYARTIAEMQHYLVAMMEKRRKEPKQDLISDLIAAQLGGERPLTEKEILSALETMLVAGNETTTNAMGNALLLLTQDKELEGKLRADPELIHPFVEECLRLETSVTGVFRRATREVEVGGVKIPKDGKVFVGLASADRDEHKFRHPDEVVLDRDRMRDHIAFGYGFHNCIGKDLARLEMVTFFKLFLETFKEFSLAIPVEEVKYHPLMGLKGLSEMPLNLVRA
jgi:cytochrome P450